MTMSIKEQENIKDIHAAKDCYDQAAALLGDRESEYRYKDDNSMIHAWGFGNPRTGHLDRRYMFHRVDGPALYSDRPDMAGGEVWHTFGELHRLDGPAVTNIQGGHEWWLYGVQPISWKVCQQFTTCPEEEIILAVLKGGKINQSSCDLNKGFTLTEIATILAVREEI